VRRLANVGLHAPVILARVLLLGREVVGGAVVEHQMEEPVVEATVAMRVAAKEEVLARQSLRDGRLGQEKVVDRVRVLVQPDLEQIELVRERERIDQAHRPIASLAREHAAVLGTSAVQLDRRGSLMVHDRSRWIEQ